MAEATLPTEQVQDWDTFHDVSATALGFPSFYGRNSNAWIDCMSYLTEDDGMSSFVLSGNERLLVHLPGYKLFAQRHPEIAAFLLDCVAAVNSRYIGRGDIPRLALVPS